MKLYSILFLLILTFECSVSQTFKYITGPVGNVYSIISDNAGNIYLGTEGTGVYRSTNNGDNWSRYSVGGSYQALETDAFTFNSSGNLVAAASQSGIRIFNGTIWTKMNTGFPLSGSLTPMLRAVALDSSGNLFAGAIDVSGLTGGMFIHNGSSWSSIQTGLTSTNIYAVAVSPAGTVYCGTNGAGVFMFDGVSSWSNVDDGISDLNINTLQFDNSGNLFAGTDSGCSILKANTFTWMNYNSGLPIDLPILSLAIDPTTPAIIIAGLGHTRNQVGSLYGYIYISCDSGKTWTNAMPDVKTLPIKAVHIKADGTIFAVGQGIFRSTDHGVTFQTVNTGFRDMLSTGTGFAINSKDHLFYSSNNGVFKSTDLGVTWTNANNGLTRPIVNTLFVDSHDKVFAAMYSGDKLSLNPSANLFRSTDDGNTWNTVEISRDNQYYTLAEAPDGKLYCSHGFGAKPPAAIVGSSLAVSVDNGVTWTDLNVKAGAGFSVAVNKRGDIFHGGETDGPFRSTDGGLTWDTDLSVGGIANIGPIAISPNDEIFCNSYGLNQIWFSDSLSNGKPMLNMTSSTFPQYHSPTAFAWGKNNRMYITTRSQSSPSGLFYTDPPWSANTTFTAVPSIPVSPFAMQWDSQGYLWMQGVGFMAKSDSVLGIVNIQSTLPVELTSFTAVVKTSLIELNWKTATEVNNYGFEVEKIVGSSQSATDGQSPNMWVKIGFVQGSGNSNSPKDYSFVDTNPNTGKSYYRLKMIDIDGSFEYSEVIEVSFSLTLTSFELFQNYPNPFNPETVISYQLPVNSFVTLKVYDVLGKEVVTLVNKAEAAGSYKVNFNASELSSGIYLYKLQTGGFIQMKKMLLLK